MRRWLGRRPATPRELEVLREVVGGVRLRHDESAGLDVLLEDATRRLGLDIRCPDCGVGPLAFCRNEDGLPMSKKTHAARRTELLFPKDDT